jgi:hypothetical protein
MDSVGTDLANRFAHWRWVASIADQRTVPILFGQGMGRYPAMSLGDTRHLSEGSYLHADDALRVTTSATMVMSQRLSHQPVGNARVRLRYRALAGNPSVKVFFARRPLLVQQDWYQPYAQVRRPHLDADWREDTFEVILNRSTEVPWYRRGFDMFGIYVQGKQGTVEIDSVEVIDQSGTSLIRNGNFEDGLDHWFAFNDIWHLAWHIKSLYLTIGFEQGLLGLLTLLILLAIVLPRLLKRARRQDAFALALISALVSFLVLGLTSTLFDVPQMTFMFWLLVMFSLYRLRARPGQPGWRQVQHKRRSKSHSGRDLHVDGGSEGYGWRSAETQQAPGSSASRKPQFADGGHRHLDLEALRSHQQSDR